MPPYDSPLFRLVDVDETGDVPRIKEAGIEQFQAISSQSPEKIASGRILGLDQSLLK